MLQDSPQALHIENSLFQASPQAIENHYSRLALRPFILCANIDSLSV